MLSYLHIRGLAIADDLEIELKPGFNVMTGETGAGKSIVVDAVGLLSGGRAYREMIRTGDERAVVEGVFTDVSKKALGYLENWDIPATDPIQIKRVIHRSTPSRAFINGELVPLNRLAEIGPKLVQIHSQNDQQLLLQPENHLEFLDDFAGNGEKLEKLSALTLRVMESKKTYRSLLLNEKEKNQEMDMLRFQIREIETVDLKPEELENLMERKSILKNAGRIKEALGEMEAIFHNEEQEGLVNVLGHLNDHLAKVAPLQSRFQPYLEPLNQAITMISELEQDISETGMEIQETGMSLDEIESRLVEIERLQRKYGESYPEIIKHLQECRTRLSDLEELEFRVKEQGDQLMAAHRDWWTAAIQLSETRKKAATRFTKTLKEELGGLAMPDVKLKFQFTMDPKPPLISDAILAFPHRETGLDHGELLISPNIGEELKPLTKVASGGEISRIMLAIKAISAGEEDSVTAVFDEVDAGIGGQAAVSLATKLRELSLSRQVLCVTHLGQVAAAASGHFSVSKTVVEGRTCTMVQFLSKEQRLQEIARMTGGREITETSLKHAAELIGGNNE
ncbi:MAG: DNA repair protein RecN [Acidobacteria bacterium]|nr:MAG: DNA repair protein RecN [Acidobacteriota bacterium]